MLNEISGFLSMFFSLFIMNQTVILIEHKETVFYENPNFHWTHTMRKGKKLAKHVAWLQQRPHFFGWVFLTAQTTGR